MNARYIDSYIYIDTYIHIHITCIHELEYMHIFSSSVC